jgi:predicted transcriptional regulator
MSKQSKLLNFLQKGNEVTAKQIAGSFGLKNPHDAVYQLRNQGYCVYGNKAVLSDGTETMKYRLGKPSRQMISVANRVLGAEAFSRV